MASVTTLFNLTSSLPPSSSSLVLVTGFFDLLHSEHRQFLDRAKRAGDYLVVGLESDLRARQLKGQQRPFQPQLLRAHQLAQLNTVDLVVLLPLNFSQSPLRRLLIRLLRPHILAVSSHTPHQDRKRSLVEQYGGCLLVVHQHNPKVSTTSLSQKLYNHS